jgi:hypothetical protein
MATDGLIEMNSNILTAVMRERLLAAGMPEWHVEVQVEFSTALESGQASTATDTVETVTGRPPRTFDQFIREHLALFNG